MRWLRIRRGRTQALQTELTPSCNLCSADSDQRDAVKSQRHAVAFDRTALATHHHGARGPAVWMAESNAHAGSNAHGSTRVARDPPRRAIELFEFDELAEIDTESKQRRASPQQPAFGAPTVETKVRREPLAFGPPPTKRLARSNPERQPWRQSWCLDRGGRNTREGRHGTMGSRQFAARRLNNGPAV